MKDGLNLSHNGGGVAYLLQSIAILFNPTVYWWSRYKALTKCCYPFQPYNFTYVYFLPYEPINFLSFKYKKALRSCGRKLSRGPNSSPFVRHRCTSPVQYKF